MGRRPIGPCLRHDPARGARGKAPPKNVLNLHSRKCVFRDFGGGWGELRPFWAVFIEQE